MFLQVTLSLLLAVVFYPPLTSCLEGFTYRWQRSVTVSNPDGSATADDTDIVVNFDTLTPISTGSMRSDCADLDVLDDDEVSLPFWLEAGCGTLSTSLWIRVGTIPPTSTVEISIRYGSGFASAPQRLFYYGELLSLSDGPCFDDDDDFLASKPTLVNRYLSASQSVGQLGGTETHRHDSTVSSSLVPDPIVYDLQRSNAGGMEVPAATHTHDVFHYTSAESTFAPPYVNFTLCRVMHESNARFTSNSLILTSESISPVSETVHWESVISDFGIGSPLKHFIRLSQSTDSSLGDVSTDILTDGSHTHVSNLVVSSPNNLVVCLEQFGSTPDSMHSHSIDQVDLLSSGEIVPPHIEFGIVKRNGGGVYGVISDSSALFDGMVLFTSAVPPLGWTGVILGDIGGSSSDSYLISLTSRMNLTTGSSSVSANGSPNHSHNYAGPTPTTLNYNSTFSDCHSDSCHSSLSNLNLLDCVHDHSELGSFLSPSTASNLPPYYSLRLVRRKIPTTVDVSVSDEICSDPTCFGLRDSDPRVCGGHVCSLCDVCICSKPYYGSECQVMILDGIYSTPEIIAIPYVAAISLVERTVGGLEDEEEEEEEGKRPRLTRCEDAVIATTIGGITGLSSLCNVSRDDHVWCNWALSSMFSKQILLNLSNCDPSVFKDAITGLSVRVISDPSISIMIDVAAYDPFRGLQNDSGDITAIAVVLSLLGIVGLLVVIGIVVAVVSVICVKRQKKILERFEDVEDIELMLKEQESGGARTHARLRINRGLFKIDFDEVELLEEIAQGGSKAKVYRAKWQNQIVAYKLFQMRRFAKEEEDVVMHEIQQEIKLLASLIHPYILSFHGATMKELAVGILTEFCPHGDLMEYVMRHKAEEGEPLPLAEKLRLLSGIASAMEYVHQRGISLDFSRFFV